MNTKLATVFAALIVAAIVHAFVTGRLHKQLLAGQYECQLSYCFSWSHITMAVLDFKIEVRLVRHDGFGICRHR